jgi:hypothetical protein
MYSALIHEAQKAVIQDRLREASRLREVSRLREASKLQQPSHSPRTTSRLRVARRAIAAVVLALVD